MSEGTGWRMRHPAKPHMCGFDGSAHVRSHSRRMRRLNSESSGRVMRAG